MYLFAVCLSCYVAEANGGHAGHGEVERSHVHRELRGTAAHLIKENALVTTFLLPGPLLFRGFELIKFINEFKKIRNNCALKQIFLFFKWRLEYAETCKNEGFLKTKTDIFL